MADRSSYPSEQADKFLVRLDRGMKEQIAAAAKAAGRSMNAEILYRLKESFGAEVTDFGIVETRIRDVRNSLEAAHQRQHATEAEIAYLAHALNEALAARDELTRLDEQRQKVRVTVKRAEKA